MTDREQSILALLYEERVEELTPAYLAYRLRIASSEAAELLDSLVRSGTLDLNFDSEGNISYRLPAVEYERLKRQPVHASPSTSTSPSLSTPYASPYDDASIEAHFFGSAATARPEAPSHHQYQPSHPTYQPTPIYRAPEDPNGYDGTAGHFSASAAQQSGYSYGEPQQRPGSHPHSQQQAYQPPLHHNPGPYTSTTEQHGYPPHPHNYRGPYAPPNTQMVPYHHQHHQLVEVQHTPSPGVAAFLSFVVVGGGQWYNGEYAKGAWMFIGCMISWLFLMGWIVTFWSIIDAYTVAKERRALPR